jgi:hypothetical protein
VYGAIAVLTLLSWLLAFKPTVNAIAETKKVEVELAKLVGIENESRIYNDNFPFVLSKDTLSLRDEKLLQLLDKGQLTSGYEIVFVQPYAYSTRSGTTIITSNVSLKGTYFSFINAIGALQQFPNLGKISSVHVYLKEDRVTKRKWLLCDLTIQIITEL